MSLLGSIRVLDLGGEWSGLCGMLLAQMGADVIRVEPPGGDIARRREPTVSGIGLPWAAFEMSKRSVTLDLTQEDGRLILLEMIDAADVVVESHAPGRLAELGLAPDALIRRRPSLVVTSLTAFGQDGPRVGNAANDTTVMALSGLMAVTGFTETPPLRLGYDQIGSLGGLQAALGTLIALFACRRDGLGQHVDVSVLDAARLANYREPLRWEFNREIETRRGNKARRGQGGFASTIWRCADGWITWSASDDPARARSLFDKANELGIALEWKAHDFAAERPHDMSQHRIDDLERAIGPYFELHTRDELEVLAKENRWILIALLDAKEAAQQPQLKERGFWTDEMFGDRSLPVPAFPFVTSMAQPIHRGPAPKPGQHTDEVLRSYRSGDELATLRARGVI